MANPSGDDLEPLLFGAELLDGGVVGDAEWSDAMVRRFGDQGLREKLPAIYSMARELRLHPPGDRRQVAIAMLEHRRQPEAARAETRAAKKIPRQVDTARGTFFGGSGEAGDTGLFPDTVITGHRGSPASLVMSGVMCLALATMFFPREFGPGTIFIVFLLIYLGHGFVRQLRAYLRPPRISIRKGNFEIRLQAATTTPARNVASISLEQGKLLISFRNAALVQLPSGQSPPPPAGSLRQQMLHLTTGGDIFTLDQVNRVRRALGLAEQQREVAADRLSQFRATLSAITPYAFVTPTIVLVNVAVFAALSLSTGTILLPDVETMVQWGANFAPLTTTGQWWRLVTSMFLHFGILHLAVNMWVLWAVGRLVERIVGNAAFAVAYLTAGFLGSVASVLWNTGVVSAGASGAVFGVFGLLIGFLLLHRKSIPWKALNEHRNAALVFLALNLIFGFGLGVFGIKGIDMAAHVGGLIAGFGCGLLLSQEISPQATMTRWVRTVALTAVALVVCGASVYFLPDAGAMNRSTTAEISKITADVNQLDRRAQSTYQATVAQYEQRRISPAEAQWQIERDIVADYVDLQATLDEVGHLRAGQQRHLERLRNYLQLRKEGWSLAAQAIGNNDVSKRIAAEAKFKAAKAIFSRGNSRPEE
jgi:membrane associated rhomboid family serine protease